MSSLMSSTDSVNVNSKRNLVRPTKNSCFELSLTAPTQGARSYLGVKRIVLRIQRYILKTR